MKYKRDFYNRPLYKGQNAASNMSIIYSSTITGMDKMVPTVVLLYIWSSHFIGSDPVIIEVIDESDESPGHGARVESQLWNVLDK